MPVSILKTRLVSEGASSATILVICNLCKAYPVTPIHLMFSQVASQSLPPSSRPDTDMVGRWLIQNRQVWESEQLARVDRHLQSASDILESLGSSRISSS